MEAVTTLAGAAKTREVSRPYVIEWKRKLVRERGSKSKSTETPPSLRGGFPCGRTQSGISRHGDETQSGRKSKRLLRAFTPILPLRTAPQEPALCCRRMPCR